MAKQPDWLQEKPLKTNLGSRYQAQNKKGWSDEARAAAAAKKASGIPSMKTWNKKMARLGPPK